MTLYIVGMFFVEKSKTSYMWCIRDAVDESSACNDAKSTYEGEAAGLMAVYPAPRQFGYGTGWRQGVSWIGDYVASTNKLFSVPESGRPVYKNGSLTVEGIE